MKLLLLNKNNEYREIQDKRLVREFAYIYDDYDHILKGQLYEDHETGKLYRIVEVIRGYNINHIEIEVYLKEEYLGYHAL